MIEEGNEFDEVDTLDGQMHRQLFRLAMRKINSNRKHVRGSTIE